MHEYLHTHKSKWHNDTLVIIKRQSCTVFEELAKRPEHSGSRDQKDQSKRLAGFKLCAASIAID